MIGAFNVHQQDPKPTAPAIFLYSVSIERVIGVDRSPTRISLHDSFVPRTHFVILVRDQNPGLHVQGKKKN